MEKKKQEDHQERRKLEETLNKNMVKIAINDDPPGTPNTTVNNHHHHHHHHQNGHHHTDSVSLNDSTTTNIDNLTSSGMAGMSPSDHKQLYMDILYNFECERINFKLNQSVQEINETDERSNGVSDVMCTMMEALCDGNESYNSIDAKIIEEAAAAAAAAAAKDEEVVVVNGKIDDQIDVQPMNVSNLANGGSSTQIVI